jgi:tetratricopeptide (TPR) repeat protein
MRMNRFSSVVLIGIVLCTSENDRSLAAGNGAENAASIATPEDEAMRAAAYKVRLKARTVTDEGFFLGRKGDFRAARKKLDQAIELDPKFSPAYHLRAGACMQMGDWAEAVADLDRLITLDPNDAEIFNERGYARRQLGDLHGAQDDFDRCIALGTDLALAYANRAEVEHALGDDRDAAADVARVQSLAPPMPPPPEARATSSARKKRTHHETSATRTSKDAKGATGWNPPK